MIDVDEICDVGSIRLRMFASLAVTVMVRVRRAGASCNLGEDTGAVREKGSIKYSWSMSKSMSMSPRK